jgi:hypothetical protein
MLLTSSDNAEKINRNPLKNFETKKGRGICSHDPKSIKKDRGLRFTHGLFKVLCCSNLAFYPQAHLSMMTCHHQPLVFELAKFDIWFRFIV